MGFSLGRVPREGTVERGYIMIRVIVGFFLVFGAVGGIDNATDAQLLPLVAIAALGLVSMYFGVQKVNQ